MAKKNLRELIKRVRLTVDGFSFMRMAERLQKAQ